MPARNKIRVVPTMIGGTGVSTRFVGTAVPTIIVLTAYYWKSCVLVTEVLPSVAEALPNFCKNKVNSYSDQLKLSWVC